LFIQKAMPCFSHARLTCAICVLAFAVRGLAGEGIEASLSEALGISPWNLAAGARVGGGYKDNTTLSAFSADASPFLLVGADVFVLRAPWDGTEFQFLFTGEDRRYLDSDETEKEQTFLASSHVRRCFDDAWKLGLEGQYFYLDQIFDASATELDVGVVRAVGHSGLVRPSVGRALGRGLWFEIEGLAGRYFFEEPLDDYWELGPRFRLRWEKERGEGSMLLLTYEVLRRSYDDRVEASRQGVPIEGTELEFVQQKVECSWQRTWDEGRRWRTATRIGLDLNRDNGSGYFDYDRYHVSEQVRLRWGRVTARARVGISYYDYALQTVSDLTREKRHKMLITVTAGADYRVGRRLKAFGEYEYERSVSNQDYDAYRANTVFGGFEYEF